MPRGLLPHPCPLIFCRSRQDDCGGGCRVCRASQPLQGLTSSVWGPLMLFVQNVAQVGHLEQKQSEESGLASG